MQRQARVHLPQQRLQSVAQLAVPGEESGTSMHVGAGEMGGDVNLLLLVPIRDAVRVQRRRVERQKRVTEQIALGLRDLRDVAADSVSKRHCAPSVDSVPATTTL